jgi:hypothetical protein
MRKYKKSSYIIGDIAINEKWVCDTLEPLNCIPIGIYQLSISKSPKFGKYLVHVDNVYQRDGILIHAGNTVKDTEGCILPGYNRQPGMLLDSSVAENELFNKIRVCNLAELCIYDITKED